MKIVPYQYAPYLNINKNSKTEKNEFIIVTSTGDRKSSKTTITNTKSEISPQYKSPISVISNETTLNFIKELKPDAFKSFYGSNDESKEQPLEPPQSIANIDTPRSSKLDNLSFITSEILKTNSFKLDENRQSSLDIVNYKSNEQEITTDNKSPVPVEVDNNSPVETNNSPVESNNSPVVTDNSPTETDKSPIETEKPTEVKEGILPKLHTNMSELRVLSPIKSAIEGFKTEIMGSPLSAIYPIIGPNYSIRNELQSNMNGTVFQNNRFNTYLETINTINDYGLENPSLKPLHVSYKENIRDSRNQLRHRSDIERYTFKEIINEYDEEAKRIKDMSPMTEQELVNWLSKASTAEIYDNLHKILGIPKKVHIINNKTMEVTPGCPNYPTFSIEQYIYKEPKAFPPLHAKFKNLDVTISVKESNFCCTSDCYVSKLNIFPFPLHIAVGTSSCDNILNVHIVIQNPTKDYCIKTLSFNTASETIAMTYSDILYQNIYYDEQSILRTSFVQIYVDKDNEDLHQFVNRWFRVPFELASCYYEIITDIAQVSSSAQVFIFMTKKKDVCRTLERTNKWEDSLSIVHQTIYGHPLQVIMAALKERLYERWMLEYNDWKRYKTILE